MNTDNTPAPDHGEPWKNNTEFIRDRMDFKVAAFRDAESAERTVKCVNACAGMADPAATIAAMREAIKTLVDLCERAMTVIQSDYPDTADMDDFVTDFDCTRQELQPFLK